MEVQRLTLLITPDGEWLPPDSAEFRAALGDPAPDYDGIAFAVKNLGFIKFEIIEKSILEIELHPRNVGLPALLLVQQQLQSSPVRLFRIKYFDTEWRSEISCSAEHTISRLSEICAPAEPTPASDRFRVEPRDISLLYEDEDNPMRPLAQKWRVSFGVFDPGVISLAVTNRLLPRLMIAGLRPRQTDPIWRFIGDGHQWIGNQYRLQGLGEKVANMPDKDYGLWATTFYRSVAANGSPRYDLVTGSVQYEDETGRPLKPVHYERLMLPWKTASDEVFVTMVSRRFGTDDLPSSPSPTSREAKTSAMSS